MAFLILAGLISCSDLKGVPVPHEVPQDGRPSVSGEAEELYWWRAKFINALDEDEEPRWVSDLMVADLVIEPVIVEYASTLALWRFHRRAVHDANGHIFSFIFYADRQTAAEVFAMIERSPDLARLIQHGLIEKYVGDLGEENDRTNPGATSDGKWSVPLQEVWPAYIMGASVTWLGLINQFFNASGAAEQDFDELVGDYEKVNMALGTLWREEGQHAFLHHLNALFGYEPMLLKVKTEF
ncbi:MAG: hypothetical protein KJ950_13685 [Proteobacteria bacterium]|nr:hypothetical protein [Pseudomonadota bacterium]MBU1686061.1 hypothetical protein [Pseudomonadota bacterium]